MFPREFIDEKVGRRDAKKKRNDGGGERRKRLPANPTILENCVRPRTQLLIGAVLVVSIKSNKNINQTRHVLFTCVGNLGSDLICGRRLQMLCAMV